MAVVHTQTILFERVDQACHPAGRARGLELERHLGLEIRADHAVVLAPAMHHQRCLRAHHLVDATDLVADFPGDLEQERAVRRLLRLPAPHS